MVSQVKPSFIRLETSTFCQLKCPSCETAQGITQKKLGGGFLKFDDFKKLVDENPEVSHIELSNWGEMFLNPDIVKIMEYAYQKNVALTASNGVNLNTVKEPVLEALVKYKFRHMSCSVDGISQETYQQYRVGGNFNRVLENIKSINRYKELYKSEFPQLRWQFVIFSHNEHELLEAKALAESLNMQFHPKLSWDENIADLKNRDLVREMLGAASRSEYRQMYGTGYIQKYICSQLWTSPQINWNGEILGCCYNYWGSFGNAFESGLMNGLNSDKIAYARQMLRGEAEPKEGIPCTTCSHYQHLQADQDWLTDRETYQPKREKLAFTVGEVGLGRFIVWLSNRSKRVAKLYTKYFRH